MLPTRLETRISKLEQSLDTTARLPWSAQTWRSWSEHTRVDALCHLSPNVSASADTAPALKAYMGTLSDSALQSLITALTPPRGQTP